MMKYTIKTLSELLGISAQTIRYYESKGILKPTKNETTGYRYYSVWDYAMLLMSRRYLKYGCSVNECADILNEHSPEESIRKMAVAEDALCAEIGEKIRLLNALRDWRAQLTRLSEDIGRCRLTMRPAMYRLENMTDTTFIDNAEIFRMTQELLSYTPFVFNSIRYTYQDVSSDTCHRFSGIGIPEADALRFGLRESEYLKLYPAVPCVELLMGGENFDTMLPLSRRIRRALDYIEENGLRLSGDVITRMDYVKKQGDGYFSYQTAWFPV